MTNDTQAAQEASLEAEIQALQANIEVDDSATSEEVEAVADETIEVSEQPVTAETDEFVHTDSEKVQAKFNKLTWKAKEAERQLEAERQAKTELAQKLAEFEARSATPEGKPRLADFDLAKFDYNDDLRLEAFNESLINYNLNQMQQNNVAQQRAREQEARKVELNNKYLNEVESYADKSPSYYEDVAKLPLMSPDKLDLLRNQGAKLTHFMSRNPDEVAKFVQSDIASAAFQLGTLSARLQNNKPNPKPTNAPEPVETISGTGRLTKDLSEMSMEEIYNM